MHDTARCLGYLSDSMRAARERARAATYGYHLRWTCQAQPGWVPPPAVAAASPLLPLRTCGSILRPCGSTLRSSPLWLITSPVRLNPSPHRPCGPALRSSSSPLSHLAGVGDCPLANGYWCLVGLLAGMLDRRPVSPLQSTSACSGAGSGWHGRHGRGQIADSTVHLEGLAPGGAGLCPCAFSWAVTVIVRRITSVARLRLSRGYRTERGLSAGPAALRMRSRPSWHLARAGPIGGPVTHDSSSNWHSRWARPPRSGRATTQLASGLLTIGRWRRRWACSRSPPTRMLPARAPDGPGTQSTGLEVITVRVHSGNDSSPVRAVSACPMSAE